MATATSSAVEPLGRPYEAMPRRQEADDSNNGIGRPANGHATTGNRAGTLRNGRPTSPGLISAYRPPLQNWSLLSEGQHSLSGISVRAMSLGVSFGIGSTAATLLAATGNSLWRAPFFIAALSVFHFLEFWITAKYNTPLATPDAFLLTANGMAYNAAHVSALLETTVRHGGFSGLEFGVFKSGEGGWWKSWMPDMVSTAELELTGLAWAGSWRSGLAHILPVPSFSHSWLVLGFTLVLVGQVSRSLAMATAGRNFNHTVQTFRQQEHELVTSGVYAYLRHPSYFGFFWWAVGTQLVLANRLCLFIYAAVLWYFFYDRIRKEERFLTQFFGKRYEEYRKKTTVGIPGIW